MDTTALRIAYDEFFEVAAESDLGSAADGGWDADHVLAHMLSVDAGIAAAALAVVSGSRPAYDNRTALNSANLGRIIAGHPDRAALIDRVRAQSGVLCDIADGLSVADASVVLPVLLLSNDVVVVDQPVPLGGLIGGLADTHVPEHARQIRELRVAIEAVENCLA